MQFSIHKIPSLLTDVYFKWNICLIFLLWCLFMCVHIKFILIYKITLINVKYFKGIEALESVWQFEWILYSTEVCFTRITKMSICLWGVRSIMTVCRVHLCLDSMNSVCVESWLQFDKDFYCFSVIFCELFHKDNESH